MAPESTVGCGDERERRESAKGRQMECAELKTRFPTDQAERGGHVPTPSLTLVRR